MTKEQAQAAGWKPGKVLGNGIPGGQIGGDVFENANGLVPGAPGRTWREADLGINLMMTERSELSRALLGIEAFERISSVLTRVMDQDESFGLDERFAVRFA
ncbi:ribonuclease domain-containing protein [Actinacidiphila yeochonensis]|uniref:ribonuclease domain-containing protein n=1 Tax=Actinacidiphila yeochonensis TaxID=89050 RepID=UPI00099DD0B8